jgi:hypothetical protein
MIVNVGNHLGEGRKLGLDTKIKNIVTNRRHRRKLASQEPGNCDGPPSGSVYEMGNPGNSATAKKHTIGVCPDPSCPTLTTQPNTCIPDHTNTFFNALNLFPDYGDEGFSYFEEFRPGYGEGTGTGWFDYMQSFDDPNLFRTGQLWSGCDQDRAL